MKRASEYKSIGEIWDAARSWRYWLNGRKGVYILLGAITRMAYNEGYEYGKKLRGKGPYNSNTATHSWND